MARINLNSIELVPDNTDWNRQSEVEYVEYSIFIRENKRYVHIKTFGSSNRSTHPKPSQDIVIEISQLKNFCNNL